MQNGFTQKEVIAHRLYRVYGVRAKLALGVHARKLAVRAGAQRKAGLAELAVVAQPYLVRGTFQTEASFQEELLAMRCAAHTAQVQVEVHA